MSIKKPSSKSYLSRVSKITSNNELKNESDENDQAISVKLGLVSNNNEDINVDSKKPSLWETITNSSKNNNMNSEVNLSSSISNDSTNWLSTLWFIFRILLIIIIVIFILLHFFGEKLGITQWYYKLFNKLNLLLGLRASKQAEETTQNQSQSNIPAQNLQRPAYENPNVTEYPKSTESGINKLNEKIGDYKNAQLHSLSSSNNQNPVYTGGYYNDLDKNVTKDNNSQLIQGPYNFYNKKENKWYNNQNTTMKNSISLNSLPTNDNDYSLDTSSSPNESYNQNNKSLYNISTPMNTPKVSYGGYNNVSQKDNSLSEALAYAAKHSIPSPDDATSMTQQNQSKSGYCYIGEDRGFRSCIQVGANDTCMSGDIFPTLDVCVNPNLRP